jgi:hypothetical protein
VCDLVLRVPTFAHHHKPQKVSGSLADVTVSLRSDALDAYIKALLRQDASLSNIHVLSFLGLMNLNRFEEPTVTNHVVSSPMSKSSHNEASSSMVTRISGSDEEEEEVDNDSFMKVGHSNRSEIMSPVIGSLKSRPVMHVSTLRAHAAPGDLILFRCANSMSGLQVSVSSSH